jgi:hypothetical protein
LELLLVRELLELERLLLLLLLLLLENRRSWRALEREVLERVLLLELLGRLLELEHLRRHLMARRRGSWELRWEREWLLLELMLVREVLERVLLLELELLLERLRELELELLLTGGGERNRSPPALGALAVGLPKKIRRTPPPPPPYICYICGLSTYLLPSGGKKLRFFKYIFGCFSVRGVQKHHFKKM